MGQEIEIKLTIDENHIDLILAHPMVQQYSEGPLKRLQLMTTYYDTPLLDLHRHRMALRVRAQANGFIQTLKTQGESLNGLSRRKEWEWPLTDEALQPTRIPTALWPPEIVRNLSLLRPVFRTDFLRSLYRIHLPENRFESGQTATGVELAYDRGSVSILRCDPSLSEAISEIEMELLYGEIAVLRKFACVITTDLPISPCDISKAERGYRLFRISSGHERPGF